VKNSIGSTARRRARSGRRGYRRWNWLWRNNKETAPYGQPESGSRVNVTTQCDGQMHSDDRRPWPTTTMLLANDDESNMQASCGQSVIRHNPLKEATLTPPKCWPILRPRERVKHECSPFRDSFLVAVGVEFVEKMVMLRGGRCWTLRLESQLFKHFEAPTTLEYEHSLCNVRTSSDSK